MSAALFESIARIARHEARARALAALGKVVDIHPAESGQKDHAVSVELRDSKLVLPRVPIAVGALGFVAIPKVGDLVVVAFLDGDLQAPLILGRLYHPDLDPPDHGEGEWVVSLPPGQDEPKLELRVSAQAPELTLKMPGDLLVTLSEGKASIKAGDVELIVEGAGGGRATLEAGSSRITLKKDGDITIESGGKLVLKGQEVEIDGSSKTKISGGQVEIN